MLDFEPVDHHHYDTERRIYVRWQCSSHRPPASLRMSLESWLNREWAAHIKCQTRNVYCRLIANELTVIRIWMYRTARARGLFKLVTCNFNAGWRIRIHVTPAKLLYIKRRPYDPFFCYFEVALLHPGDLDNIQENYNIAKRTGTSCSLLFKSFYEPLQPRKVDVPVLLL